MPLRAATHMHCGAINFIMRLYSPKVSYTWLCVLMVALLAVLAWLQYRWTGELSLVDRHRKKRALGWNLSRFSNDFDREITRLFFQFYMEPGTNRDLNWDHPERELAAYYAHSYQHWLQSSPYPRLFGNAFLVTKGAKPPASFFRLKLQDGTSEKVQPEGRLRPILARIEELMTPKNQVPFDELLRAIPILDDDLPGLVLPCIHFPITANNFPLTPLYKWVPDQNPLQAFIILQLDSTYLFEVFLPQLVQGHFFSGPEPEYEILVKSHTHPGRFLFQTNPQLPVDNWKSPDEQWEFFRLHTDEFIPSGSQKSLSIPPSMSAVYLLQRNGPWSNLYQGRWKILALHRTGSLEKAAQALRWRNLAISLGILTMLGGTFLLAWGLNRRTQQLADQQMNFMAGISHEFRTPLSVICSAADNLAEGIVPNPLQVKEYGSLIRSEGRRLSALVEQVMDFAGLRSGKVQYSMQPLDPGEVIETVLTNTQLDWASQGFEIEKKLEENLPLLWADRIALSSMLENLLRNALKYSDSQRWIGISARKALRKGAPGIVISISDHGLGIPARELSRIFEPFYRGREAQIRQIRGSGLGLTLVRQVVHDHGGEIHVTSQPGQGSTFKLWFPVTNASTIEEA
jgi:two-component system, OmpR family, sensor histidine kinase SenX3